MYIACFYLVLLTTDLQFLTTFDECMLPRRQEIEQSFDFLVKSPSLTNIFIPPLPHEMYIDKCIMWSKIKPNQELNLNERYNSEDFIQCGRQKRRGR